MADREQDFRLRCNYGHDLTRLLPQCARDILEARPVDPVAYMGGWLHRSVNSQMCRDSDQRLRTKCSDLAHEMDLIKQHRAYHVQEMHEVVRRVREHLDHRPILQKEDSMNVMMARFYRRRREATKDLIQSTDQKKLPRIPFPPTDRTKVDDSGQRRRKGQLKLPPIKTPRTDETEVKEVKDSNVRRVKRIEPAEEAGNVLSRLPPINTNERDLSEPEDLRVKRIELAVEAGNVLSRLPPINTNERDLSEPEDLVNDFWSPSSPGSVAEGESISVESTPSFEIIYEMDEKVKSPMRRWASIIRRNHDMIAKLSPAARKRHSKEIETALSSQVTIASTGSESSDLESLLARVIRQFQDTKQRRHIEQLNKLNNARHGPKVYGPLTDGIKILFNHPTLGVLGDRKPSIPKELIQQDMDLNDFNAAFCFNLYDHEIYVVCDPLYLQPYDYLDTQIDKMTMEDYGYVYDDDDYRSTSGTSS